MKSKRAGNSGFTLIEVIATLIIIGVLAAIAGMGIVNATRGYLQARENSHLAQKAQIALARIYRELSELTDVPNLSTAADPWLVLDNPQGRVAFSKVGNELHLYLLAPPDDDPSDNTGDVLIDQVDSLTFSYFQSSDTSGTGPTWNTGLDIELLSAIEVKLGLRRQEGNQSVIEFTGLVHPRNNNNFGGAPPTSDPVTAKQYECFITTAGHDSARVDNGAQYTGTALAWIAMGLLVLILFRQHRSRKLPLIVFKQSHGASGNIMVGLVVTVLIFAALGAGLITLTNTSTTSQIMADSTSRSYYLAESGFRYAASEYMNTIDTNNRYGPRDERNQTLKDLHNQTFNLASANEKFKLTVYPYYLAARNYHAAGSTTLQLEFSGARPEGFTLPGAGTIKVADDDINAVYTYGAITDNGDTIDLVNINGGNGTMNNVYQNAIVQFIGNPAASGTITDGGTLDLATGNGGFFPKIQGKININGELFGYDVREGDQLQNLRDANDPARTFSVAVDAGTEILLEPFVQIRSQGIFGQGELQATREVTYNVPIPNDPSLFQKLTYYDDFDDVAAWQTPALGTFSVASIGGDSALKVATVEFGFGVDKSALIEFNWSTTRINFASAHRLNGRFLSYDAQTKIGFDSPYTADTWSSIDPDTSAPDGLPKYFAGGIAFRLDINQNTYALSLMRGSSIWEPNPDRIDNTIVPLDQVPMIVLWEQTGDGAFRQWLAYSEPAESVLFADDMESGTNGWTSTIAGDGARWSQATNFVNSGSFAWTTSPSGTYVDGDDLILTSPALDLSNVSSAVLTFWTRYRIYSCDDYGYVEISNDGIVWERLNFDCSDHCAGTCGGPLTTDPNDDHYTSNQDTFVKKFFDISNYTGLGNSSVQIRFLFDRNNNPSLTRDGWWVDDVKIITKELINTNPADSLLTDPTTQQIVLMLRVIEAAVIDFDSGGLTPIEAGDIVTQASGAGGTVVFPPVLYSGSWAGGDAQGMLWLNKTNATDFAAGSLDVPGKGTNLATVLAYTPRTNLIKAYYATVYQTGTPDGNPYDVQRLANDRGTVKWPIDEGDPLDVDRDFFTLIEWDPQVNASVQRIQDENGKFSIITANSLTTPSATFFPATRPEIGLITLGHGATRVYYDDLGLQVYVLSGSGFLNPIQQ